MGLVYKELLESVCRCNGWSYGVFWSFDSGNSMLLTVEDVYHHEETGVAVNSMLKQVHILGEGIVGQAALSGKKLWIFAEDNDGNKDIYEDNSEIHSQFASRIKTIAVIPVESGVVQFGSTQKLLETSEFLDQMKRLFSEMENVSGLGLSDNPSTSLNYENCDLNEWFASFCNGSITPVRSGSCAELMEIAYSSLNFTQSSAFLSDFQQEDMDPLCLESSCPINSLQTGTEDQVILSSNSSDHFQRVCSLSTFIGEKSAVAAPCISSWNSEGSISTSLECSSEMLVQNSPYVFSRKENAPLCFGIRKQDIQSGSNVASLYSTSELVCMEKFMEQNSARSMNARHSVSSFHAGEAQISEREAGLRGFVEDFGLDDFSNDLSSCFVMDNLLECVVRPENVCKMAHTMDENVWESVGVTSTPSNVVRDVIDIPFVQSAISVQSSITDLHAFGGQEKVSGSSNDQFEHLRSGYGCVQAGECQENIMKPLGGCAAISTGISECISELDVNSAIGSQKGLLSELGLQEVLNGSKCCSTDSHFEDQFSSPKRRRTDSSLHQVQSGSISCSSSTVVQPAYHDDKTSSFPSRREMFPESKVGLWIDDSCSNNNGSALPAKSKKCDELAKTSKKRARPGESTRPRPKDRQQIQDRIKELKGIIPDGAKCSIDALLDRTIKYMLFLQSVTKYADKLKQANEPKLISKEQKTFPNNSSTSGGGATWALEVGDQSTVCPIIVEDLSTPGLMLIEMLCEDQGFFLEIADVVRGFGLNILKGVMETRKDKIWAHFIVEAKTHITRIEIFWSLVELLQLTSTSCMDSTNQPSNAMNVLVPPLKNYQQPALPCPIRVADTFQ